MEATVENRPIWLRRPDLEHIPEANLPSGLAWRYLKGGHDADAWLALIRAAETFGPVEADAFSRAYGANDADIRERVCFLQSGDLPVATVGAWYGTGEWEGWGRIHWLYVLPAFQGAGLGKVLLTFALGRLKELGHSRVCLKTSSGRLPALRLYARYGFTEVPAVSLPDAKTGIRSDEAERQG
ncbi:MAG: GNAT family N-acetyltransferase [Capsulimonadales bacterium]|nr:GNAT family N-acetyltransferase [Capsulimonadales bacterium]